MIKRAITSLSVCFLISCGMVGNIKNKETIMNNEIELYKILIKSTNEESNNPKDVEIYETFKAAIRLVSQQSDVVSELPNLGVYEPYTPKAKNGWRFYFNTLNAQTTLTVKENNPNIVNEVYIYINKESYNNKKNITSPTLYDINLNYSFYEIKESLNDSSLNDIKLIYEYQDNPNINIAISIDDLSSTEIKNLLESRSFPENFSSIMVFQADQM